MSLLFGRNKKQVEKTVLLLDIENASVGGALMELSRGAGPKLFGEKRIPLPIFQTLRSDQLLHEVEKAAHEVLLHSRARASERGSENPIQHIAVFLGAPWNTPSWKENKTIWDFEPSLKSGLERALEDAPVSFYTFGDAAVHTVDTLFEHDRAFVLCVVTGEVLEIFSIRDNTIIARATVPFGAHTLLRTIASHAGVPLAMARSALHLTSTNAEDSAPTWLTEPLSSVGAHFAEQFTDAANDLYTSIPFSSTDTPRSVMVVAPEPLGDLFARILGTSDRVTELFPEGGTVRALRAHHIVPHIAEYAPVPDLHLMAEALFVHKNI